MAVAPAEDTPEGRAAAMALLDPDLQGILQRADTSAVLQSRMAIARVRSINKLSAMADTREQARNFCRATLRLDLAADLFDVACVVESWEACRTRTEARHKMEAEAALSRMPKAVNKVELRDIRDCFERAYYVLEEKAMPAASTLELHFDQVDNGEWKAMMLTQYLSRDDAEAESWGATVDSSGNIKVKRGYSDGPKPKNTEDLRARVKLVGHTYIMAMLEYPHKATLQGLTPTVFQKCIDHLLGEHVWGLRSKDENGQVVAQPSWDILLSYEYQVRKKMVKQMNDGVNMVAALDAAVKDINIKENYFLTPASFAAMSSPHHAEDRSRSPKSWNYKGWDKQGSWGWDKKGSRKGAGKGKRKSGNEKLHSHTPDGREICFKWNDPGARCRFQCGRVHCCQKCFGPHPAHSCKGPSKDTAGGTSPSAEKK